MVGSSSSCTSFGSLDDVSTKPVASGTIKFLCSYGCKILPHYLDDKLRYIGGHTRVLTVDHSPPFSELQGKMGDMCGSGAVNLRCQLSMEDLDILVFVTFDEDLTNLIEEYDLASHDRLLPLKIRAFLLPPPSSVQDSCTSFDVFHSKPSKTPKPLVGTAHCPLKDLLNLDAFESTTASGVAINGYPFGYQPPLS